MIKRIGLLIVAALMAAMRMVATAAPAFAVPPNPIHGQQVAAVATLYPTDPVVPGPFHGQTVSAHANPFPTGCQPNDDVC